MHTPINIDSLKTVDASFLDPGHFFLHASRRSSAAISIGLRCANYENPPFGTVLINRPELTLTAFRKGSKSGKPGFKLDVQDIEFEIDHSKTAVSNEQKPGLLLVNDEEATITVRFEDPRHDEIRMVYLSLRDWTQSDYPLETASAFSDWRLFGRVSGQRVLLLSP